MTNLEKNSNIHISLAQGAYRGRVEGEMLAKPTKKFK
jgi:hypothetical protein